VVSRVELVVLGLLADDQLYGYELLERFRDRSMGLWTQIARASVYQALQRLERKGEVSGRDQEGREGPDRRVFRITRTGRARLAEGLVERFGQQEPYDTQAGLAMGFVHLLRASDARAALAARERALNAQLDAVHAELKRTFGQKGRDRSVSDALLQRQEALVTAELGWLSAHRASLARGRG
jgi:DNA-binding PadR family transcriptional regulator